MLNIYHTSVPASEVRLSPATSLSSKYLFVLYQRPLDVDLPFFGAHLGVLNLSLQYLNLCRHPTHLDTTIAIRSQSIARLASVDANVFLGNNWRLAF